MPLLEQYRIIRVKDDGHFCAVSLYAVLRGIALNLHYASANSGKTAK